LIVSARSRSAAGPIRGKLVSALVILGRSNNITFGLESLGVCQIFSELKNSCLTLHRFLTRRPVGGRGGILRKIPRGRS